MQVGIHGMCQSNYAIEESKETKDMIVSQVVDISNCREKAAVSGGMAAAMLDKMSQQVCFSLQMHFILQL